MAQQTLVRLVDDIDGGEAEETVSFGIDRKEYEIDLSGKHVKKLRELLAPFVASARRAGGSSPRRTPLAKAGSSTAEARAETQAIREWAKAHKFKISDRGRIPSEVLEAYASRELLARQRQAPTAASQIAPGESKDPGKGDDLTGSNALPYAGSSELDPNPDPSNDELVLAWWRRNPRFKQPADDKVKGYMRAQYKRQHGL